MFIENAPALLPKWERLAFRQTEGSAQGWLYAGLDGRAVCEKDRHLDRRPALPAGTEILSVLSAVSDRRPEDTWHSR